MEQPYIVSARKYRPASFETVVGQRALTETLRNAIRSNHLAHELPHAYRRPGCVQRMRVMQSL